MRSLIRSRRRGSWIFALAGLLVFVASAPLAFAPPPAYEISWWTTSAGAPTATGGAYRLDASIGQHDAGEMSGAPYDLRGGFLVFAPATVTSAEVLAYLLGTGTLTPEQKLNADRNFNGQIDIGDASILIGLGL